MNDDFVRFCSKCKYYVKHDDFFGYCVKYSNQCRWNDTCKVVLSELFDL